MENEIIIGKLKNEDRQTLIVGLLQRSFLF